MKKAIRLLQLCLLGVLIFSLVMLGRQRMGAQAAARDYDEAARIAGLPERKRPVAQDKAQSSSGQPDSSGNVEDHEPVELDLGALQEVNGDVVGWIEIPGTELSYPLLQGSNNQYYLNHTWSKESSPAGSIYLDYAHKADFSGFHTIIYGHRMMDDTMFGTLKYYNQQDFLQEHPSVYITREDGVYRFDIFAAYEADVFGIVYETNLSSQEKTFIRTALNSSAIDAGITPTAEDHILTLSTCTKYSSDTYRWVVQGRLAGVYEPGSPDLPW